MKTLLAVAALAAVIASPAFAQTGTRRVQAAEHPSQFDQTVGRAEAQPRSAAQGTTVYDNNHYLGADPDPTPGFSPWRTASEPSPAKIEMHFSLAADR